jgi:hypothetical protein
LSMKPFLPTKHIAVIRKQSLMNYNWSLLTLRSSLSWLKPLTRSDQGLLLLAVVDPVRHLSFTKRAVDGCMGVEPRRDGIVLSDVLCDLMASMIREIEPCPFLSCTLTFALQQS